MALVEWPDFDRHRNRVSALASLSEDDLEPLLLGFRDDIAEAHRKNVFSGIQPDGTPTPPVTYRTGVSKKTKARRGAAYGIAGSGKGAGEFGGFKGFGPFATGLHNNLSREEYEGLTGPALAPRWEDSRIITNLVTFHGPLGDGQWEIGAELAEIADHRGNPFMSRQHFEGGSGKVRDYRGVSEWLREKAAKRLRAFVTDDLLGP